MEKLVKYVFAGLNGERGEAKWFSILWPEPYFLARWGRQSFCPVGCVRGKW